MPAYGLPKPCTDRTPIWPGANDDAVLLISPFARLTELIEMMIMIGARHFIAKPQY